jgi:hypothetical protein
VSGFLKLLPKVICFGANAEGAPVLEAMRALPDVLAYRRVSRGVCKSGNELILKAICTSMYLPLLSAIAAVVWAVAGSRCAISEVVWAGYRRLRGLEGWREGRACPGLEFDVRRSSDRLFVA